MKLLVIVLFILSEALAAARPGLAQGLYRAEGVGDVDVEPPLIEHELIGEAEADIRQTFVATVVDDGELDSVVFYYRYAGEKTFSRYVMMQVSYSSVYIAQIPTDPNNYQAIEYYIQARDISGNRTVRGYSFSPLVRSIVPPASLVSAPVEDRQSDEKSSTGPFSSIPKTAYVVGGVVLLGLVVSLAGSSSGDPGNGPGNDDDCGASGCQFTFSVERPF